MELGGQIQPRLAPQIRQERVRALLGDNFREHI